MSSFCPRTVMIAGEGSEKVLRSSEVLWASKSVNSIGPRKAGLSKKVCS